ncbi:hypothetical protein As57867_004441, partial [Aphanomyces stellatus]
MSPAARPSFFRGSLSKDTLDAGSLLAILQHRAASTPTKLVLSCTLDDDDDDDRPPRLHDVTFAGLDASARRVAGLLQSQKKGPFQVGDIVLLWFAHESTHDLVAAFYGCLYAGAIAVVVNPDAPDLARLVSQTRARLVLSNSHLSRQRALAKVKSAFQGFTFKASTSSSSSLTSQSDDKTTAKHLGWYHTDAKTTAHANLDHVAGVEAHTTTVVACLQYTAGTSAPAKPVVWTHANLLAAARHVAWIHSYETTVQFLPPHTPAGLFHSVVAPVFTGARVIHLASFRPRRWLRLVATYGAVHTAGPASAYARAAASTSRDAAAALDVSAL